jgi:predicted transcriptional regulator
MWRMDVALTPSQANQLVELLEVHERAVASEAGQDTFVWHTSGGMGSTRLLTRGAHEDQTVDPIDMQGLIAAGMLQQTGQRAAIFTADGLMTAQALQRERRNDEALDVSWEKVQPVVEALLGLWASLGAPAFGVAVEAVAERVDMDKGQVERLLDLLESDGWVEKRSPGFISPGGGGPTYAPTPRALQRFAGWPTLEETVGARFLEAIDAEIENTRDEEKRGRLRRLREVAVNVGEATVTQVLTRLATGEVHL